MTTKEIVKCVSERLNEIRRRFSVHRLALFGSAIEGELIDVA